MIKSRKPPGIEENPSFLKRSTTAGDKVSNPSTTEKMPKTRASPRRSPPNDPEIEPKIPRIKPKNASKSQMVRAPSPAKFGAPPI